MQNDISKHCTKFQKCSSNITKVTKSQSFHKCFFGFFWVFFFCTKYFCLDKIHFGETIILAGLVSLVRRSLFVPHLWKLCDFVTFAILELHFWDLVQCLLISLCMGSEILVKIGLPLPPKKNPKPPKNTYGNFATL